MELIFLFLLIFIMAFALASGFPLAFALPGSAIITISLAGIAGYLIEGNANEYFISDGPFQWLNAGITNFSRKNKAKVNLFGSLILGIPLCLTIFFRGMACKQCVLNQPIINFETSQSTQGMNIKYLMAGFLIIFALTMLIQFLVYSLRSLKIIKEEN